MITIEKIDVYGFETAIRGMRNPMNSWDKSDSKFGKQYGMHNAAIGANDKKLMINLVKSGSDHRKFMRMINVSMDVKAPLYWWKEFDTYKVGTVTNSCSTMHKIHDKEFTLNDFSHEHLQEYGLYNLNKIITVLNYAREVYLETKYKEDWWQMIQLLPSSFNQLRTVQLNYEVLYSIYFARKDHKLDEWHVFCDVIKKMPLMEDFIKEKKGEKIYVD